ncbi:type II toxin-antitoxin system YafQ family toxin [Salmonella enterica]|nr:type II toxin-antitoxin system YafQ family toxin [Salmonella enterica]EBA1298982.1 type II toxin-antitoxin system YafQ family toxin [Salmonella enterica]EBI9418268.1 type II toxin-antitoxin system YafQ family toxin [Salmonella enterica]EBK9966614.1 type II toxin-antitoxin system YafQ family toxin [Salmonella enterica]EBT7964992.1 type II toxin-antitoxin system YafQ family toxin [Salmonella enterica]
MRKIERSSAFKRDYKRESKKRNGADLDEILVPILIALASDKTLEPSQCDHNLTGNWSGFRECHIKPDLLLIYKKPDDETLKLARMGSHSELFG